MPNQHAKTLHSSRQGFVSKRRRRTYPSRSATGPRANQKAKPHSSLLQWHVKGRKSEVKTPSARRSSFLWQTLQTIYCTERTREMAPRAAVIKRDRDLISWWGGRITSFPVILSSICLVRLYLMCAYSMFEKKLLD